MPHLVEIPKELLKKYRSNSWRNPEGTPGGFTGETFGVVSRGTSGENSRIYFLRNAMIG